jgi:hypothetical protein
MRMTRHQATVKLDIDKGQPLPTAKELTGLLRRAGYRPIAMGTAVSPSGRGYHVLIHVSPRPVSAFEVVALQLLLGGDRRREALQMLRARNFAKAPGWMRDRWNVLYLPHSQRMRHVSLQFLTAEARPVVVASKTR